MFHFSNTLEQVGHFLGIPKTALVAPAIWGMVYGLVLALSDCEAKWRYFTDPVTTFGLG